MVLADIAGANMVVKRECVLIVDSNIDTDAWGEALGWAHALHSQLSALFMGAEAWLSHLPFGHIETIRKASTDATLLSVTIRVETSPERLNMVCVWRKGTEQTLRHSIRRYPTALSGEGGAVWETNKHGKVK